MLISLLLCCIVDSDEKFQPSPSSLVKALPGIVVAMVAIVMTVVVALMVVYMIK